MGQMADPLPFRMEGSSIRRRLCTLQPPSFFTLKCLSLVSLPHSKPFFLNLENGFDLFPANKSALPVPGKGSG